MRELGSLTAALLAAFALHAQEPRLGALTFPTSGAPAAQEHFIRGVLFLHSFEYGSATQAFREAQRLQPDFAMAYWGEAMTYNHPIWNERDPERARAALARLAPTREARRALAPTPRERAYLDAVETLWGDGPKADRDTAYARAMERVAAEYPDDPDARAFYALSLLGLSSGIRVVPTYMRAAAIAEEIFDEYPDHPGAVHYLIHSYDDPVHAPLGLRAARSYARIAPDAAHAQHMTSHIFLAMGMWNLVVSQNTIAAQLTWWGPGHYTYWLGYGLEQMGRHRAAREHLERARTLLVERPRSGSRSYFALMRAHHVANTEQWSGGVLDWEIDLTDGWATARAAEAFIHGFAALRRGEVTRAERALAQLATIRDARSRAPEILEHELQGLLALAAQDVDGALLHLHAATVLEDEMPLEFGPPDVVKPSHELHGEVLLELGRFADAQAAFERALALAPGRALSLRGLARAAHAAGDGDVAAAASRALRDIWEDADPNLPGLAEIRRGHSDSR